MYIPSNIVRLPNIILIPDQIASGGAGTKATFTSVDSGYRYFDLEENTNYSIGGDTSAITVTKKTLIRATLHPYTLPTLSTQQNYLFGIFDNITNVQIGSQGGFGYIVQTAGTSPNGVTLYNYHNFAEAVVDANTSFYIKIVTATSTNAGIYYQASKVYLFQLEA